MKKIEYRIKIEDTENEKVIELNSNQRVILRADNIIVDIELNFEGTPLINLYPYSSDTKICGIIYNEIIDYQKK